MLCMRVARHGRGQRTTRRNGERPVQLGRRRGQTRDSLLNIDFGTAFHKPNGNAVKVTINEFRDKLYLHIRDYTMDGDTGQWFPTKTGFSIPADEVSSLIPLLNDAAEAVAQRYIWNNQLELEFEELENEYEY